MYFKVLGIGRWVIPHKGQRSLQTLYHGEPLPTYCLSDKSLNLSIDQILAFSDEDMTKSVTLEGLGGPMTRARTKKAKEAIVLAALIQKELNLEGCKPKLLAPHPRDVESLDSSNLRLVVRCYYNVEMGFSSA
ncbi:hypothetical protein CR513_54587, partial [Mucuna pruriens]